MGPALYPRLLGPAWWDLDESVQSLHSQGNSLTAVGTFRIQHGNSWAHWLVQRMDLPPATPSVPTRLVITPSGDGEHWFRTFGDQPFVTTQEEAPGGLLAERMGLMEIRFRLRVLGGALLYQQQSIGMRWGRGYFPLPVWLVPRVEARESPGDGPRQTRISVHVVAPVIGLLLAYEGTMIPEENTHGDGLVAAGAARGDRRF